MKENAEKIVLSEFISSHTFRTIDRELFNESFAKTKNEVQVIIDISDKLQDKLSFQIPERKQIFGFANFSGTKLGELQPIKRVMLEERIESYYMLVIHRENQEDDIYEVDIDELAYVLEHCRRIPSLTKSKK